VVRTFYAAAVGRAIPTATVVEASTDHGGLSWRATGFYSASARGQGMQCNMTVPAPCPQAVWVQGSMTTKR
jgi:hypothetical protein